MGEYSEGVEARWQVRKLASLMEEQLQRNDHKGKEGWRDERGAWLMAKLIEEVHELFQTTENESIPLSQVAAVVWQEAADIANVAMMVADTYCVDVGAYETGKEAPDAEAV